MYQGSSSPVKTHNDEPATLISDVGQITTSETPLNLFLDLKSTRMGHKPTDTEHSGTVIHPLHLSATSTLICSIVPECVHPFLGSFGVIILLENPWSRTQTQLPDTGPNVATQNPLVIFRFHDASHTVKAPGPSGSKTTPKHLWTFAIFYCEHCFLLFAGLILFLVNSGMMCFSKKLYLGLICPQDVFPEGFWLTHVIFSNCRLLPPRQDHGKAEDGWINGWKDSSHWHWYTGCRTAWICVEPDWGWFWFSSLQTAVFASFCSPCWVWNRHPMDESTSLLFSPNFRCDF